MKTLKLIKQNTNIQFLKYKKITLSISIIFCLISFFSLFINGLNFGIDFKGGSLIEVKSDESINISDVRSKLSLLNLGDVQIQNFGSEKNVLVRVEASSSENNSSVLSLITNELETFGEIQRTEVVGPKISSELIQKGILAIISAVGLMLFYIWIRFEWQFSLGAILALFHDVIVTLGLFSLLGLEINLSIIAAVLTIVGYSMNDTVVIFDRVRENLRKYSDIKIFELTNISINETLSRTLITSITTLLALLSIFFFGGEILRGFSLAMIFGVIFGTYSSIYIANTVLVRLRVSQKTVLKEDGNN